MNEYSEMLASVSAILNDYARDKKRSKKQKELR